MQAWAFITEQVGKVSQYHYLLVNLQNKFLHN